MSYVEDYVNRLNAIRANQVKLGGLIGPMSPPVSKSEFANLILQNARSDFSIEGPKQENQKKGVGGHLKSVGKTILDVLSRGNYAAAEALDTAVNEGGNPLKGAWEGLSGKEKTSFIDVLQAAEEKGKLPKAKTTSPFALGLIGLLDREHIPGTDIGIPVNPTPVQGLAADFVLDPINLVGAGLVKKPLDVLRGGSKAEKILEAGEDVASTTARETPAALESQALPEGLRSAQAVDEAVNPSTLDDLTDARYAMPKDVFNRDLRTEDFQKLQKARNIDSTAKVVDQVSKGNPAAIDLITHKLLNPLGPVARAFTNKAVEKTVSEIRAPELKNVTRYNASAQGRLSNSLVSQVRKLYKEDTPEVFDGYINMLRNAEEGMIEHGRVKKSDKFNPRGGNSPDSPYLRLSDVLTTLPRETVHKALFGAKKVVPSTILKAVTGNADALRNLSKNQPELFDAIHEIDWAPLMTKEYATRVIETANQLHRATNDAAGFIAAKLADNSSDVSKASVVDDITAEAKKEFKDEMPEAKRTFNDMLDGLRKAMPHPVPNVVDAVIQQHKDRLAAGVFRGKNGERAAQAPRIKVSAEATADVLKTEKLATEGKTSEQLLREAGLDVEKAALAADGGIYSTVLSWFNPAFGYKQLRPLLLKNVGARRASATIRANNFTKIFNAIPENEQLAFWTEVRGYLTPTPGRTKEVSAMQKIIHNLFGESGLADKFAGNTAIARSGTNVQQLNKHLRIVGIKDFKFQTSVKDPATGKMLELEPEQALDSWKYYQPKDAKDLRIFVSNLTQAVENAMVEYSTFAQLAGMYGSKTARNGTIKLTGVHPAINDMYFPKDLAPQIGKMALGIDQFTEPLASSKFMKFYDQGLRTWKSSVTIYTPSHHVRNFIGDSFLSWMDGMNNPLYFKKAASVLLAQAHRYSDIKPGASPLKDILGDTREAEIIGEMMGVAKGKKPRPDHVVVKIRAGKGKTIPMTRDQVYQMGFRHGIFPHSSVIEDLPGSETFMERLADKYHPGKLGPFAPAKGQVAHGARALSETREHFVRMAHWMHALEHPNTPVNSLEELFEQAAGRVRKYHPDGLDLTPVERKVFRRLIPFYSWNRKAIPLIVEGLFANPGKIVAYPKAMSGLQEAQGIDSSVSEPWPEDQLFPDWLSGNVIGPVLPPTSGFAKAISRSDDEVGYTLINPGTPATDMMEDLFNNPVKGIGNQITPAIKIPAELAFGQEFMTGAPIDDYTEYADKNLPPVAPFSRLTQGLVGTGLLEGGDYRGKETSPENIPALINILTGAGILDTGRYIKGGEFDLKKRLREQNGSR